jgi:DNA-binding transcriptional LysR family regulator
MERRLTLHQLRIFKAVVDHQSFTRAAEALCLSQPGVTHQVQALTEAVGHPVFQGNHGRMDLTPVGRAVYERARQILGIVNDAEEEIDGILGCRTGSLRLAAGQTVASWVLPVVLAAFNRAYPDVRVKLGLEARSAVYEQLHRGKLDLGVVRGPIENDELEALELLEDELICLCAPSHPLVNRQPVGLTQLVDGPLLVREDGSGTREVVEETFRGHGVKLVPAMEVAGNEPLKRLIAAGHGVSPLSTHAVRTEVKTGQLVALNVVGFPLRRTWHMVWCRGRVLNPATKTFLDLVRTPGRRAVLNARGEQARWEPRRSPQGGPSDEVESRASAVLGRT